MDILMRMQHIFIALLLICTSVSGLAISREPAMAEPPQFPFIEPANEYHIRFPKDRNPFVHAFTDVGESHEQLPDGSKTNVRPMQVKVEVPCDIFRVVQLHGDTWILVEHPASTKDYAAWGGKHRASFMLHEPDALSAEQLANVKKAAAREIVITRTWVNLTHAITIAPVSAESLGLK